MNNFVLFFEGLKFSMGGKTTPKLENLINLYRRVKAIVGGGVIFI